jgi:hypothetical protein
LGHRADKEDKGSGVANGNFRLSIKLIFRWDSPAEDMAYESSSHPKGSAAQLDWRDFPSNRGDDRDIRRRETFRGLGPRVTDSKNDFAAEILEAEVVVNHIEDGHVYHFPILSNGTVNLEGSRIEANPKAKCEASRYLSDALGAAQAALSRPQA